MEKEKPQRGSQMTGGLTLKQKILVIRKNMPYFQKDTQGFNYQYVAGCAVLESFREIADKLGVLLVTKIIGKHLTETKIVNDKNIEKMGRIIDLDLVFTFMDTESEETLEVPFAAYGEQQDCSKAFGSALTYAERYFLLKFFTVPTDKDDPDTKGQEAKEREEKRQEPTEDEKKQSNAAAVKEFIRIELGNKLSKSHLISLEERDLWEKKKNTPDRQRGIDYMIEKNHLGEQLENHFYMKIMAGDKDLSKKDAQAKAREQIIKEYAPLSVKEAKEKYKDELK